MRDWHAADSLRSRVRRLVADARTMADGGFWKLMHRPARGISQLALLT